MSTVPKSRNNIVNSQLQLLLVIFKFRFVSSEYIGSWFHKDKSTMYERLLLLVQQGYINKHYESSYRLRLRPAEYSLSTKGIRYLRSNDNALSELALRNMYKNQSVSMDLIDHSLAVCKLCLLLRGHYPDTFDVFTRSEMSDIDALIRPLPDLYLRRFNQRSTKPDYQLEIIDAGTFTWIILKRLRAHQDFYEDSEDWDTTYPTLLVVCANQNTEKRIQRLVLQSYFDFEVYTTTEDRLTTGRASIWLTDCDPNDDEATELIHL